MPQSLNIARTSIAAMKNAIAKHLVEKNTEESGKITRTFYSFQALGSMSHSKFPNPPKRSSRPKKKYHRQRKK